MTPDAAVAPAGVRSRTPGVPPAGVAPVLEAIDLEVTPPGSDRPSVRGVSLSLRPGEWLALSGANGGGKTSLLLALAGLWPLSGGTLTLDGAPFGPAHRDGQAAGVAVVLQDPSSQLLQPTVAEELAFTARNLGAPEDRIARDVARWSTALGLDVDLTEDPATLSAGRQQVVLLIAALVSRPRLLIADEPTAHLDPETRRKVRSALAAEVRGGMAVLWATQDPEEASAAGRTLMVGPAAPALGQGSQTWGASSIVRPAGSSRAALTIEVSAVAPGRGPRVTVSQALTLHVPGDGVTALLGPNGAGKSVVLGAAAGLEDLPQVRLRWTIPSALPPIMALQYPELQVFEEWVADEVVFAAVSRGRDRREALAAAANHFESIGLDHERVLSGRTWALSTGEKRLIEVIGAMIAPSSLVLLDEPTAGLDAMRRQALADLVLRRAAHGPVMVASQDIEWVERVGATCFHLGR